MADAGMPDPGDIDRPWLASYPPGVPPTYRYPEVPLTRFLDDAARDFPDAAATWFRGATISFAALVDHADRFASALAGLGIGRGDRVVVAVANTPAALIAMFGAWRIGAIVVPLAPDVPTSRLVAVVADTGCAAIVGPSVRTGELGHLRGVDGVVDHVVVTGTEEWLPARRRVVFPLTGRRGGRYRRVRPGDRVDVLGDLIERSSPIPGPTPVGPDDPAVIAYRADEDVVGLGAVLTHRNLVVSAFQTRLWLPDVQAGRERVLGAVPLVEPFGLTAGVLTAVLAAATLVLVDRHDRSRLPAITAAQQPTIVPCTPGLCEALLAGRRRHDLSSIRVALSTSGLVPDDLVDRLERRTGGARIRDGHAAVETGGLVLANPIYGRSRRGTIGLPVTDTTAIVVDPGDPTRPLPAGEVGALAVHGPQVMAGYWQDPDATAARIRDGWLVSDDLVRVDADGFFTFVGRPGDEVGSVTARRSGVAEGGPAPTERRTAS